MRSFLQLLIALLTLVALAWAVRQGYSILRTEQLGLDAYTQSLVIIATVILIVCTFILNAAIRASGQTAAQARLLPRKVELYEGFVLVWQALTDKTTDSQQDNLDKKLQEIRACLSIQASKSVLQAINELTRQEETAGLAAPTTEEAFEKLLLAMRSDLGQSSYVTLTKEVQKLVTK